LIELSRKPYKTEACSYSSIVWCSNEYYSITDTAPLPMTMNLAYLYSSFKLLEASQYVD